MEQGKLFFSYARADNEFALKLAKDLRAAGIDLWIDQLDIDTGQRWDRAVESALAGCPALLVILSPASVGSTNVMDEVSYALEERKGVLPVVHQPCKIPFRLRRVQHTDLSEDYAGGLARLVEDLREHPDVLPAPAPPPGPVAPPAPATEPDAVPPPEPGQTATRLPRLALIAAAAIAVLIVGLLIFRGLGTRSGDGSGSGGGSGDGGGREGERREIVSGITLPAFVILDSAFEQKRQAQRRLVELGHSGLSNTGFFWIPDFEFLSGAELFQVYVGPFETRAVAEAALCRYNRKMDTTTYGVRLSTQPGRVEFRCRAQ